MEDIKNFLKTKFEKITDLGEVKQYLGLYMSKDGNQLLLNQEQYIMDMIRNNNIDEKELRRTPAETPLPTNLRQILDNDKDADQKEESMEEIVGQLRYLADRTRPDIAFAASFLARFAAKPTKLQKKLAMRTINYLYHTKNIPLIIGSNKKTIELFAMADSNHVRGGDSKAQLCFVLYLSKDSGPILLKSQKDKNVSISPAHSELNALVEAVKAIIFIRTFLKELNVLDENKPTIIYEDNQTVTNICKNIGSDQRSKYLITKINFVREAIDTQIITINDIKSKDKLSLGSLLHYVADIGTKSLEPTCHANQMP